MKRLATPRALRRIVLRAADAAAEARRRWRERGRADAVPLEQVRRRLEMLLTGVYGRALEIAEADAPERPAPLLRLWELPSRHLRPGRPQASASGDRVRLPPAVPNDAGAFARYRLMAVEQAERLVRGTALGLPGPGAPQLERDLYLLCEAAAVDRALVARVGGTAAALRAARDRALAERPPMSRLRTAEREPELLLRRLLESDPTSPPAELPLCATPADSRAWARRTAAATPVSRRPYRGLAPVEFWGEPPEGPLPHAGKMLTLDEQVIGSSESLVPVTRSTLGGSDALPDDFVPPERAQLTKDPEGAPPPSNDPLGGAPDGAPGDAPDEGGGGQAGRGGATVELEAPPDVDPVTGKLLPPGVDYPEWDDAAGGYIKRGVTVRPGEATEDDGAWATAELAANRSLVRQVRERFERLRARRLRLGRQRDGDDLDIRAVVDALVDMRAKRTVDDRLYATTRVTRRGLAVALLVDVSGSTQAAVSETHRIVDVEKVAALLAAEAFDSLGDLYGVFTFSGVGAHNVRVTTIKDFHETNGLAVRRRLSAVAPDGNTRLGAALRHATALLGRQPAGHRLLIVLSDGRPNDMGGYQEAYAVEDSRRAVLEARAAGVRPFCLTVDREDTEYLPRIFGPGGHTMVRHPDHVPAALLGLVRQLLA